jgi:ubiquinone/menaquinone biosynthesis C-methylase UbiE
MTREIEERVAAHYAQGALEQTIMQALAAAGADPDRLTPADLAPVDEFHIGGRQATIDFAGQLGVTPGMSLLDIGCGLGGASRYFAQERRCRVSGIDLTAEYAAVAETLAQKVGLASAATYRQASALALPFSAASFDGAYMLHVGMNIADKAALFAGVKRVLRPGGLFGIYDVTRQGEGELRLPVPWAATPETSFLATAADYRRALEATGFEIVKERDRRDFALAFFAQLRARTTQAGGPPPLGLHLLMGPTAPQKIANMIDNLERGVITPTEFVCRAGS